MNEKRIVDLEIRMTHLENYLSQLNEIVLANGQQMEVLEKNQSTLRQQMNEVTNQLPGPEAAKPPHY